MQSLCHGIVSRDRLFVSEMWRMHSCDALMRAPRQPAGMPQLKRMDEQPFDDDEMPAEIDFSNGVRGLHHIPIGVKVLLPPESGRAVENRPGFME
jgi:hypothetical protein